MYTIKWTQESGALNLIESKSVSVIFPKTNAFKEFFNSNKDLKLKESDVRGVIFHDGGTIIINNFENHCYIVNENGKTVCTI